MNNKVNRLHEKCLRIVYSDKTSPFEELLDKDRSVTIHKINLQILATEIFEIYRKLSPNIVTEAFRTQWISSFFPMPYVYTVYHRSESLSNLG